jgi:archaellum component FlaC
MADQPDNVVLVFLRRLDEKFDRMAADLGDVKTRVTSVEERLAGVNRRLDRLEGRFERIENSVELSHATH